MLPTGSKAQSWVESPQEANLQNRTQEPEEQERGELMRQIQTQLQQTMPKLAKHHLKAITTQTRAYYVKRYVHSKHLKYGNLNKGLTEAEFQAFLFSIDDQEFIC
jgi:hypothetical protein